MKITVIQTVILLQEDYEKNNRCQPEETGSTFHDNAILKAQAIVDTFQIPAIADDSGIEIDAFDKKPGVYSARFLGHDTPYDYKNKIILERMENVTNRTCRYVCAIAWCEPDKEPIVFEDTVECEIAKEAKGSNGFGYDPIVYYPPFNKTMAEMTDEEKNSISHRGKAIRKFEKWLNENKQNTFITFISLFICCNVIDDC